MKKHLLLLFTALLPLVASAQTTVEIDGIWYNLISKAKVAEVTFKGDSYDSYNEYSGSITIPSTVTYEGVTYSVTSIGEGAFSGCSSLTAITLPEGVTSIRNYAFYDCTSLTTITLPKGVKSIGEQAFYGCSSLTTIMLPKSVNYIGIETFANCSELTDVYCNAETVPSTKTDAFDGSYIEYATLHVPASALDSYRATAPWSEFGNIVSLTDEETGVEQLTIDNARITIYDLNGRPVATPTKDGIYIINGRKVVVKIGM